jgi:hypothetical protein
MADCKGATAAVIDSVFGFDRKEAVWPDDQSRVLAKGVFAGIDPAGRCIIKSESGDLYFNPGPASLVFLSV